MEVAKPGTVDAAVQAVKDKIVLVKFSNYANQFIFQVEKTSN